jgi:hypothetical protein
MYQTLRTLRSRRVGHTIALGGLGQAPISVALSAPARRPHKTVSLEYLTTILVREHAIAKGTLRDVALLVQRKGARNFPQRIINTIGTGGSHDAKARFRSGRQYVTYCTSINAHLQASGRNAQNTMRGGNLSTQCLPATKRQQLNRLNRKHFYR